MSEPLLSEAFDPVLDPLLQALLAYIRSKSNFPPSVETLLKRLDARFDALETALQRQQDAPTDPLPMRQHPLTPMARAAAFSSRTFGSTY